MNRKDERNRNQTLLGPMTINLITPRLNHFVDTI